MKHFHLLLYTKHFHLMLYTKHFHLMLYTNRYVLHKLNVNYEFPVLVFYSERNLEKCKVKNLKFNQYTAILKQNFKIFYFVTFGGFWYHGFPLCVVIIYSLMAPPAFDDVISFLSCANPSHLPSLYAMCPVRPVMLHCIFLLDCNSIIHPVRGVWEDSPCTAALWVKLHISYFS